MDTIKIVSTDPHTQGPFVVINKSDFNPDVHELYGNQDLGAPAEAADARVIATGLSRTTGRPFNIAVVFEGGDGTGRGVAQSTFHHFADYNWDPRDGSPSFVDEPAGDAILRDPEGLRQTRADMTNLARWLS